MVTDFLCKVIQFTPVNIQGLEIKTVSAYKYLHVNLNSKVDWSHNIDVPYKKG